MKQTRKKIKVIHSDVVINEGDNKTTLVLTEDKEVELLEEEHDGQDDQAAV